MKKLISVLLIALFMTSAVSALAQEPMDHRAMTPTDRLRPAADPAYPVGSKAILAADHIPGMMGAAATISGAFDTVLYAVNYTRTDTGAQEKWHRWVIQEEIDGNRSEPYQVGDLVTLLPGYISGMGGEGAQAEIVEVVIGVAYMVDFEASDAAGFVRNHQWVCEDELQPYEETTEHG